MRHEHHDKGTRQGSMCVTLCISPLLCFKNGGSFSHDVSSDVPTGQSLACGLLTSHFQITWDPRQWKRATRHKSNQEELTKKLRSDMDQTGTNTEQNQCIYGSPDCFTFISHCVQRTLLRRSREVCFQWFHYSISATSSANRRRQETS